MSTTDSIARVLGLISAITAIGSLLVSLLTYRRARPKVVIRRTRLEDADGQLEVTAWVINRSSVTVHFGGTPPQPLLTTYSRWWASRRAQRRSVQANEPFFFVHKYGVGLEGEHRLPARLEPFTGAELRDQPACFEDAPAHLTRLRVEIELAHGEYVRSRSRRRPVMTCPPDPARHPTQLTIFDALTDTTTEADQ